jgi:hypothetical protein
MANKLTGVAVIRGLAGTVTHGAAAANTKWLLTGASVSHDAEAKDVLHDPVSAAPIGLAFGRETLSMSIDFIPTSVDTDGQRTIANAKAASALPSIPAKITLSGFDEATTNEINGSWLYLGGGSKAFAPDGNVKMTLPIKRYVGMSDAAVDDLIAVAS